MGPDLFRLCIVCLVGAVLCVLLKRYHPEQALLLSFVLGCVMLVYLLPFLKDFYLKVEELVDVPLLGDNFMCIVKIAGIGIVTQLVCDVCSEGGQVVACNMVALCGRIVSAFLALPIFERLFTSILELL